MQFGHDGNDKTPVNIIDIVFNVLIALLVIIFFMVAAKPVMASSFEKSICLTIEDEMDTSNYESDDLGLLEECHDKGYLSKIGNRGVDTHNWNDKDYKVQAIEE